METATIIMITMAATVFYILLGHGAARAESAAMGENKVSLVTVVFWPCALFSWAWGLGL